MTWRLERLVGESEQHGPRYAEVGRYDTEEAAQAAARADAASGAQALFGLWYVTDMSKPEFTTGAWPPLAEAYQERVPYHPPLTTG